MCSSKKAGWRGKSRRKGISISALREKLKALLSIRETPQRLAASFSVGVFIGMSPLFGIHTILGVLAAWAFKLNKMATIVGVYITNPWTIVPIYAFSTWFGAKLLGVEIELDIDWSTLNLSALLNDLSHLLMPFVVGAFAVGFLSSVICYAVIYKAAKMAGRRRGSV